MVRLGELDERSNPDCEPVSALSELLGGDMGSLMRCADRVIDVPVIQLIVHERFDVPYRQNDIALLRLSTSIKLTGIFLTFSLALHLWDSRNFNTTLQQTGYARFAYRSTGRRCFTLALSWIQFWSDGVALIHVTVNFIFIPFPWYLIR